MKATRGSNIEPALVHAGRKLFIVAFRLGAVQTEP